MTMGDTEEELRDSWDDDIDIFNDEARVERLSAIAQLQNQNEEQEEYLECSPATPIHGPRESSNSTIGMVGAVAPRRKSFGLPFCTACGASQHASAKKCDNCGNDMAGTEESSHEDEAEIPNLEQYFDRAVPKGKTIHCNVYRDGAGWGYPSFTVCSSRGGGRTIMKARKRKKSMKANYTLSRCTGGEERVLGKVRARDGNMMRATAMIFDVYSTGASPRSCGDTNLIRGELAHVNFESKAWGERRALRFKATLPSLEQDGRPTVLKQGDDSGGLSEMARSGTRDQTVTLGSREPTINRATGRCSMDFKGRVTQSSVKNMQMSVMGAHKKLEDAVTLQFGKTGEDAFVMDVSYPLSLTQAFGICLALFENDGHA